MSKYNLGFRKVRRLIWLVLPIFVLWGYSLQNVAGSVQYSLLLQPNTTVTAPPVILQNGTAGTSTIYTNNTSAKVNVAAPVPTYDFVDNNTSDVDSSADKGTHSNFTAQQYGPDSIYDTLTEENTDGAGSSEWLDCNAYDSTYTDWTTVGTSPYVDTQDQPTNYVYEPKTAGILIGWFDFPSTTLTGTISVNITIYCNNDDGVGDDYADVYVDYTGSGSGSSVGSVAQHTGWQYDTIDLGSHTVSEVNNLRVYFGYQKVAAGDDVRIDHVRIGVSSSGANYEFDLEAQWTNADFDETNEELCIYGETMGSENIRVDVWNGSAWQNLFTDLSSGWNNISISSYLDSSTFTIRFKGETETSDTTQDSWDVDAMLLHVWTVGTYDYVLRVNNTATSSWQIRLKKYSDSNISRLQNCTIYFHNSTDGTSSQIYIQNGLYINQTGPWYDLGDSETIYIAMTAATNSTGTSSISTYLEVLIPNTTTYAQYIITFEIS